MQKGKASIQFECPPWITAAGSIAGKKEGEGPLGALFDRTKEDDRMGKDNWEEAESYLQKEAAGLAMKKAGLSPQDIRYLFGGDLLGQLIATSFGLMEFEIPLFGLYGACSTMGEAMSLAAMTVGGGFADRCITLPIHQINPKPQLVTTPNKITGPAMVKILHPTPNTWPSALYSIAGETTELAKPVMGTRAPAPPNFTSLG